jgi:hypothetical protein
LAEVQSRQRTAELVHVNRITTASVQIHLPGGLPMGSAEDRATAMAEFKAALGKAQGPDARPSSLRRRTGHEHSRRRVSP